MRRIKYFHELITEWFINYSLDNDIHIIKIDVINNILESVIPDIGLLPISDINADKVVYLLELINNLYRKEGYYNAKKDIKYILYSFGFTYSLIRNKLNYSSSQLSKIYKGRNVTIKCAENFSKLLNIPVDMLFDDHTIKTKYPASAKGIYRRIIRDSLKYGFKKGYLSEDFSTAKTTITISAINQKISKSQYEHFISCLTKEESLRNKVMLFTLLECNLDSSFISCIKWEDINFKKNTISYYSLIKRNDKPFLFVNKDIIFSDTLKKYLIDYKQWQLDNYKLKSDYLFQTELSPILTADKIRDIFFNFKNKIKSFNLSLTDLRNYINEYGIGTYEYIDLNNGKIGQLSTNDLREIRRKMRLLGFDNIYDYYDYLDYLEFIKHKNQNYEL